MIRNSLICKLINVQASIKENEEKKIKNCDEIVDPPLFLGVNLLLGPIAGFLLTKLMDYRISLVWFVIL